jgi:hypothetical protein
VAVLRRAPRGRAIPPGTAFAFSWESGNSRLLVTVNYGPTQGQCYIDLGGAGLDGQTWRLADLLSSTVTYERDGGDLTRRGLYLDLPAWGHHVFEVVPTS